MKTIVSMHQLLAVFLMMETAIMCGAAQTENLPPNELVEYVLSAKRLGVKESQIKQAAVARGWPVGSVDAAIAYSKKPNAAGTGGSTKPASKPVSSPPAASNEPRGSKPLEPSNDLIQYVLDAKRRGVKDTQIKQAAVAKGWASTAVDAAIAATPPTSTATAQAIESTLPPASNPAAPIIESTVLSGPANTAPKVDTSKSRGVPDDYQIGAGDVLHVYVWKQTDVSLPTVVVRPDGRITVPLIKDVEVGGLTPRQAEKIIATELAQFIVGADVTVVVTAINSKKIYILGAVKKEGTIPYTYRMTVMQALTEAGGLTDYAKRKKIYVLRTENGKDYRLYFNYDQVIKGENPEQNVELLPGDQIVIPR